MKTFSTAARLSVALVCLTTTIMLAGQSMGLVPDSTRATLKGRRELCETIAIYCSQAAQSGDISAIRNTASIIMSRNPDILSMAVVRRNGKDVFEVGDHRVNWKPLPPETSTATEVQIPIFEHQDRWGTVQIRFSSVEKASSTGLLQSPTFRLTVFVAVAGFIAYLLYLRKTLRVLDPSSVIPDRVKAMLETLAEGVLVLDRQERIVLANQSFAATVGRLPAELQGLDASQLKWTLPHSDERPKVLPWTTALRTGELQKGVPLTLIGGPRGSRTVTVNAAPITSSDGNGRTRGVLLTIDDVTMIEAKNAQLKDMLEMLRRSRDEIDRQNKELQAAATTDPLTGCRNRRAFYEDFQKAWSSAERYQHNVGCVMVDVDHFKRVNDVHGHAAGDLVLQSVAGLLKSLARDTDVVCRYGGEEFCVLLPETDLDAAARAGERFRRAISEKACGSISVTVSVGCSANRHGAESPSQLMEQADKALYAAKRTGRNRVVRFDRMPMNVPEVPSRTREVEAEPDGPKSPHAGGDREGTGDVPIAFHAVTALMSALAHRDQQTAEHCRRVADLCVAAGRSLLSLRDCFVLEVAAMLHDVGKLGVPDSILLKPGPLTDDEWKVMQTHDRMGMEITAAAFGSDELTRIVRMHHARFGGKGRDPDLPSGDEIPVAARILSIADAYDAMVSDRPYRKALTPEQAYKELRSCAGRQFDPQLVEHFVKAVSTISPGAPRGGLLPDIKLPEASSDSAPGPKTPTPFARVRKAQHSAQSALEDAMSDLTASSDSAVERSPEQVRVICSDVVHQAESSPMENSGIRAKEEPVENLEFAETADVAKAPASTRPVEAPLAGGPARPRLGRWSKSSARPSVAVAKTAPAPVKAPAKSVETPPVKQCTTPPSGDLSDERALRLRLEVERLACAAEAGSLESLVKMANSLCASARTDGLSQVADRASVLERSAAIADADSVVRVTNELLSLCRSAHQLDTSLNRGIRRRLAWRSKGESQEAVGVEQEAQETILDGAPLDMGSKFAAPASPAKAAASAPVQQSQPAEIERVEVPQEKPRQVASPFAVRPLTLNDKSKTAPEPLELEHDLMHHDSAPIEQKSEQNDSGPRLVKVTSMKHLPGTQPNGQACTLVQAADLKDCSLNAK